MSFSKLGLSQPLLDAINEVGYQKPTTIQTKAIPIVLKGSNLIAAAQTGTGKTASFVLPILERLSTGQTERKKRARAIILTPTRELALQVNQSIEAYAQFTSIKSMAMFGGVDYAPQKQALIDGVDIVVATPGRLIDLYGQRAIHFDEVETLVLDEADKMLDMGFIEAINKIIARVPEDAQSLLFSATLSNPVRDLAKSAIDNPEEIAITKHSASKSNIKQWIVTVDKDMKSSLLSHLLQQSQWKQALIFIETKHGAAKLVSQLEKRGIAAEAFHSGRNQKVRQQLIESFKAGEIQYMVATGVAARGIDIENLPVVINYDLPYPADEYVHRIGRTGRADAAGEAVSLVSKDNFKNLCMIESRLGHLLERVEIEGFVPRKPVPISILNYVPKHKRGEER
ncbi:DEAD/DEAH box helicase [Vibrio mediterranei]|uniref:ATP-dependent helicase n=1 Tax=Vibrio mediterranei TaxID=689 RepID=A0ABX5DMB0_9VIBR|nr:DEAD/DEAH box helicase [Vibrio mediterranei]MCG9657746.1 DEAD/DEAH box helicase [Vibrio mediterranei]MCG9664518.1 DEAD/DEAH box helicase [Vibrio mediterranei]NOH31419.1 DEAD/DEAH box helicase [Vibrio mediterranei]PCD90315.1 ATP-dependent helicase [Vibrio mediterranei]PRQ69701.1 ATP-dependent helicase [Vibrio mediterranei]